MSGLYSNYYVCSGCEKPCEVKRRSKTSSVFVSQCCTAPVVVKSTPYIVGTPINEAPAQ